MRIRCPRRCFQGALQRTRHHAVVAYGAVVGAYRGRRAVLLELIGEDNAAVVAEAQDSGSAVAELLCKPQHGRYSDTAADQNCPAGAVRYREAVSERAEYVEIIADVQAGDSLGALAAYLENESQRSPGTAELADGYGAAQGEPRRGDVGKLTGVRGFRGFRGVDGDGEGIPRDAFFSIIGYLSQ